MMNLNKTKKTSVFAILAMAAISNASVDLSSHVTMPHSHLALTDNSSSKAITSPDVKKLEGEIDKKDYEKAIQTMSFLSKDGFLNNIADYFSIYNFKSQKETIKKIAIYLSTMNTDGKPDANKLMKHGFKAFGNEIMDQKFADTLAHVALTGKDQFGRSFNSVEAKYSIHKDNLPSAILYWAYKKEEFRHYLAYSFAMDADYKHFATEKYFPLDKDFIAALNKFTKEKKTAIKEEKSKEENALVDSKLDDIAHNGYTFEADTEKNRDILQGFLAKNIRNNEFMAKSFFHYLVSGKRFSPSSQDSKIKPKDIIPALNSLENGEYFSVKYSDDIEGIPYSYGDIYYATSYSSSFNKETKSILALLLDKRFVSSAIPVMAEILKANVEDIENLKAGNIEGYLKKFSSVSEELYTDKLAKLIRSSKLSDTVYDYDSASSIKNSLTHALKNVKAAEKKEIDKGLIQSAIAGFLKDDPIAIEWLSVSEHKHAVISELLNILGGKSDKKALTDGDADSSPTGIVFKGSENYADNMISYTREELIYFARSLFNFMGNLFRTFANVLNMINLFPTPEYKQAFSK